MKRTQLLALSVLALGLQAAVHASPYPADADEANYTMPARETYVDRHASLDPTWAVNERGMTFPADADASYNLPARGTYADRASSRPSSADAFPVQVARAAIDD